MTTVLSVMRDWEHIGCMSKCKIKNVPIRTHAHDRNTSINKYVRDNHKFTLSQNDPWHCIKSLKKAVLKIGSGPKYLKGKSWHIQLEDKSEDVATHAHWTIRNCGQNVECLRQTLLNAIEHYKDNHAHCHSSSRCQTDPKYEPSKWVIADPVAEKLLHNAIVK